MAVFVGFFLLLTAVFTPRSAFAAETEVAPAATKETAIPAKPVKIINTTVIAEVDSSITVTLDGETLQSTEVRRAENGGLYVNAMPIFTSLNNDVEYDDVSKALIVRRSQDGVVMELYTDTGIVKADGRSLGRLKHFGEVSEGRYLLTPNAIAVLSGATGKFNKETKEFTFKLDPRLKVATGFEVFVNDISLGNLNPSPKSVGPVLLLPLLPIAEELGHDVRVLQGGQDILVRRVQDSAEFKMNLDTGLISLRGNPIGLSKDVAYIDPTNLLLPVSAIETLTGTHVDVGGGSNRIDISLDDRLKGAIKPSGSVDEAAKNTPFTPETLRFQLGPDTINTVELEARAGGFNGRLRAELPDLPNSGAELEPSWLSLDFAHVNGTTGSVGDYTADLRELDGVGLRRIRGASVQKETRSGRWAVAAGAPAIGARQISGDQSRLTFGGFAAGARYADKDGWEAGAALKTDGLSDDQMAVLSAISGRLGRKKDKKFQWDARADAGYFKGPARESGVDIRLGIDSRYDVTEKITADAFVQYDGAEFLRSKLDAEDEQDRITEALNPDAEAEDPALIPDTRQRGLDQLTIGGSLRYAPRKDLGILNNPAASVRVQTAETGAFKNSELGSTITTTGVSVAAGIQNTGVSLSAGATSYNLEYKDDRISESGRQYTVQAYKQFDRATVRLRYQNDKKNDGPVRQVLSGNISARAFNLPLPKDSQLSVSPSLSGVISDEDKRLNAGLIANFNSGDIFGQKTKVDASLGVLQSVSGNQGSESDQFFTVSVARRIKLGNNMALGMSYRNNLKGDQRVGLLLDGRFDFNEKRKYRQTKDGRGVLKGRAFVDKNRDGIKQEDEIAVPRAIIRLKGTRISLRTDNAGYFTVQNIKVGLYEVQIDARSLPLGYDLSDDVSTKVTIADGQISDVPMPIVQRGQILGFTYVDENGDGEYNKGEERVEGTTLTLKSTDDGEEEARIYSTSFGQFAFGDLPSGTYEIATIGSPKTGILAGDPVTVDLAEAKDLMMRINLPVRRRVKPIRNAEVIIEDVDTSSLGVVNPPPNEPNTMELARDGPAPP
ncbi:MAG: hypothetical protein ABJN69_16205 [Hellea sp.]